MTGQLPSRASLFISVTGCWDSKVCGLPGPEVTVVAWTSDDLSPASFALPELEVLYDSSKYCTVWYGVLGPTSMLRQGLMSKQ